MADFTLKKTLIMQNIQNISIKQLLPQRHPFVMVDKIISIDSSSITTSFLVTPQNILLHNNRLAEAGIIENIAQTAAARLGYITTRARNNKIKTGLIGEIKNLTIDTLPKVGEKIITNVKIKNEILETLIISALLKSNNKQIAYGEMKIKSTEL
jgi:predicted hotdog family 3-hydroxylacyl-ACP dehydratase